MTLKKRLAQLLAALLLALPFASAFANEGATVLFDGMATTGVGGPMPIEVDPSNVKLRADGAVGIGYTYRAVGQAKGDLAGRFQYEERGYLFFRNPADPTTFAGSRYDGGVFTLRSGEGAGASISIADSDPAGYQAVLRTARLPQLDQLLASYGDQVITRLGLVQNAGSVHYGAFTFTTSEGTFWGVSTPDSRHFLLRLKFNPEQLDGGRQTQTVRSGSDFNQNDRFERRD
jgi:hypothetical protein